VRDPERPPILIEHPSVRHGPGHNVAINHRNFDAQNVEFYMNSIR